MRKHGKCFTFYLSRTVDDADFVFTVHRAETRNFVERLQQLLDDDNDGETSVFGAFKGGPPRPEELYENRKRD